MTDHERATEIQEQAALYALGLMASDEARAFERCLRVSAEVHVWQAVMRDLAHSVPPVQPPPSLKERLLARIGGHTDVTFDAAGGLTFVKASEGIWQTIAPGISAKMLSFDPKSRRATALLRVAPGARYAPHRHTEAEEFYVLEGGCSFEGRELGPGDYHRAEKGSLHMDTSSDDGCLLLVISSPQNEILG
jgi:anti-sigma factor ChrR (cupin superfamily)